MHSTRRMALRWVHVPALAAFAGAVLFASQCGGSTSTGSSDASTDGTGSSSGGSSGGGSCNPGCGGGLVCCGGSCVNVSNDPHNCGGCGVACSGATPYCRGGGVCAAPPCEQDAAACGGGTECCGTGCCDQGQICCNMENGVWSAQCYTLKSAQDTCPPGCPQCVSDRNLKRDFEPVDEQAILEAVAHMPVSTWSYKNDPPELRHMGPMAQDFKAAFDLGDTDKAYSPIDAHGVAFAAVQALYERVEAQQARIDRLEREERELLTKCAPSRAAHAP
jgi:hypothetical protein